MIKEVTVFKGNYTTIAYELELVAFKTQKGIYTLSGSNSDGTDIWRLIGTCSFHTWRRSDVYEWFIAGKIEPVNEAKKLDWYIK